MTFKYTNRKNLVYYLFARENENGEMEYSFTKQHQKNDIDSIPEGYEVYEDAGGKVVLRKK